jgi:hypothetical protein
VFFGTSSILPAILFLHDNPLYIVPWSVGTLLLGTGLWCILAPSAVGMLLDALGLLLLGLWNLWLLAVAVFAGESPRIWWSVLGVLMLALSIHRFVSAPGFIKALRRKVSRDERAVVDELKRQLAVAKLARAEDAIEFKAETFWGPRIYRGKLAREAVVLMRFPDTRLLVLRRDELDIELKKGKLLLSEARKARIRIRDQSWPGFIAMTFFERYEEWKYAEDEEDVLPADEEPPTGIKPG